jgi:hypothetical protein
MRSPLFILLITAGIACADPTAEEEAFLRVPGAVRVQNPDETFRVSDLPRGMVAILRGYDWGAPDGALRHELHGFIFDLNKDGKPEYFFATIYGGSGGQDYMILTETQNGWKVIGGFQGGLHVMSTSSPWPELVSTSRGGGGIWAKVHHTFRGGEYVDTFIEHYDRGKITTEVVPRK